MTNAYVLTLVSLWFAAWDGPSRDVARPPVKRTIDPGCVGVWRPTTVDGRLTDEDRSAQVLRISALPRGLVVWEDIPIERYCFYTFGHDYYAQKSKNEYSSEKNIRASILSWEYGGICKYHQYGIYRLVDADTMVFCFSDKAPPRSSLYKTRENYPVDYEIKPGQTVEVYRRVREPEDGRLFWGDWTLESRNRDGKGIPREGRAPHVGRDNRWSEEQRAWSYALDVTRGPGSPWPTITFHRKGASGRTLETREGLYRLDGDTLTIRYGGGPLDDMEPGPGKTVEVYRRTNSPFAADGSLRSDLPPR